MDVSHQVLPGQQALHVHKQRLPHHLQLLEVSIQPEEVCRRRTAHFKISLLKSSVIAEPSGLNSPGHTVHRVLIGGRNHEADGRHGRLTAFIVQHPPLEGLRVVQQGALISSVHCDLRRG